MKEVALLLARSGSVGLPGKNHLVFRGKRLFEHPLDLAIAMFGAVATYVSTDDEEIIECASARGAVALRRPASLATSDSLMKEVISHEWARVCEIHPCRPDFVVILLANCATLSADLLRRSLQLAREHPEVDSVVPVASLAQWSPLRALSVGVDGLIEPWLPRSLIDGYDLSSNRQDLPSTYFACNSFFVLRPAAVENIPSSPFPFPWMGLRALAVEDAHGGHDVDTLGDFYAMEAWWEQAAPS